jgi:hypothetical protein
MSDVAPEIKAGDTAPDFSVLFKPFGTVPSKSGEVQLVS